KQRGDQRHRQENQRHVEHGVLHLRLRRGLHAVDELVDLFLRLLLLVAVALTQASHELIVLSADVVEILVGELGPLRTCLTFDLVPLSSDRVPVHTDLLGRCQCSGCAMRRRCEDLAFLPSPRSRRTATRGATVLERPLLSVLGQETTMEKASLIRNYTL